MELESKKTKTGSLCSDASLENSLIICAAEIDGRYKHYQGILTSTPSGTVPGTYEPPHKKTSICENKDADQLRGNREADQYREGYQHLCFRYIDSTIPLLSKSEILSI